LYLKLKSKQRALKRVNSKISRLNKYYNSPTELFARSFELYIADSNKLLRIAPNVHKEFEKTLKENKIKLLTGFVKNLYN
jgi:transposase